jgi:hypothetical protein
MNMTTVGIPIWPLFLAFALGVAVVLWLRSGRRDR